MRDGCVAGICARRVAVTRAGRGRSTDEGLACTQRDDGAGDW